MLAILVFVSSALLAGAQVSQAPDVPDKYTGPRPGDPASVAPTAPVSPVPPVPKPEQPLPNAPAASRVAASASIAGVVVDPMGAAVAGATVSLILDTNSDVTSDKAAPALATRTGTDGAFQFPQVAAGEFRLAVIAPGFAATSIRGSVTPGQIYTAPPIALALAQASTEVEVSLTRTEIAQVQLGDEEKQRLLGVVPNFYVSYVPNAAPLTPKQKFTLAGRFMLDPVSFGITGVTAGIQQANNTYSGYGQGAAGYAKRYAAASGTFFDAVLIGNAILPSIFKQDPRYFYKGTGSVKSRVLYAMANAVICKGDNGHWQANYSGILGGLAAGGISNLYYPAKDRDGLGLTFSNAGLGIVESAAGNIVQEFLFRRLTPHTGGAVKSADPGKL